MEDVKNPNSKFYIQNKQKINLLLSDKRTRDIALNKNSAKILGLEGFTKKTKQ